MFAESSGQQYGQPNTQSPRSTYQNNQGQQQQQGYTQQQQQGYTQQQQQGYTQQQQQGYTQQQQRQGYTQQQQRQGYTQQQRQGYTQQQRQGYTQQQQQGYTQQQQRQGYTQQQKEAYARQQYARQVQSLTPEQRAALEQRKKLLQKLSNKLLNHKGQPVSIVIFSPLDYTSARVGGAVTKALESTFSQYGNLNVRTEEYELEGLTLEEFRKAMSRFRVDVLVLCVLKNTNFDLYVYDRRTPYYIYAHSEAIPEITQLNINTQIAEYYARLVLRRTLYRYIHDQYFELPREDAAPVLQSEIPRWIANTESLVQINKEIKSRFYGGVATGAAITYGRKQKFWNSSVLGFHFGFRPFARLYLEFAAETSSYNALIGSVKYVFAARSTPFKVGLGVGWSYVTSRKVWSIDETFGLGTDSFYVVPSISLLFPIGNVYLKMEHRTFIGIEESKFMFTFMPGILVHF